MWQVQQLRFCSCFESFYCLEVEVVTTKVNERALVLEMLLTVNEEGQYSHLVLPKIALGLALC